MTTVEPALTDHLEGRISGLLMQVIYNADGLQHSFD